RQIQPRHGLQFLNVELEPAVPIYTDRPPSPAPDADPDAAGQAIAHRAQTSRVINPLSGARRAGEQKYFDAATGAAGNHQVLGRGFLRDHFRKVENADTA